MENYFLTFFSVIISVILFLITYRQTIGAKKERIKAANDNIEKILVRRIVLEGFNPKSGDINRLIEGKARDYKVDANDLLSESQIMNTIYTRIVETDFITQEQREQILQRINGTIVHLESIPVKESEIESLPSNRQRFISKTLLPVLLALTASIIGTLIPLFPEIQKIKTNESTNEIIVLVFATLGISFGATLLIYFLRKFKESSTESSKQSSIHKYVEFEKTVEDIIAKAGFRIIKSHDIYYDFLIEKYDNRYIVEVKNWTQSMPIKVIQDIVFKLNEMAKFEQTNNAIIVVPTQIKIQEEISEYEMIKILTLREFRNLLIHNKPPV